MSVPYLQRRGETYCFRIAVPSDLRAAIGAREITRSLKTPDRRIATPRALHLASQALTLFAELRAMPKEKRSGIRTDYTFSIELYPDGSTKKIEASGEEHEKDAIDAHIKTTLQGLRHPGNAVADPTYSPSAETQPEARQAPMLSAVIADFLDRFPQGKKAMLDKHRITLPTFLEIVGDKPISEIKQFEIKGFFATLNKLPPYATRQAEKRGISLRELAELDHPEVISKSSFLDTYKACVRTFLKSGQDDLHDQGFPQGLHANYKYEGKDGPRKTQRAFNTDELKRLFEGPELKQIALTPGLVHQFWLPVLGLYTGARANEICQINPQTDAGEGIEKSIKTEKARKIPLHSHLIKLGFPEYVAAIKQKGAEQLFPAWAPRGGRAAPNAIGWFSQFLKELNLYGIENEEGCMLLGMHAFRHTLVTYGVKQRLNLTPITGHAKHDDEFSAVAEGYIDSTLVFDMTEKKALLDQLDYGLSIPTPSFSEFSATVQN